MVKLTLKHYFGRSIPNPFLSNKSWKKKKTNLQVLCFGTSSLIDLMSLASVYQKIDKKIIKIVEKIKNQNLFVQFAQKAQPSNKRIRAQEISYWAVDTLSMVYACLNGRPKNRLAHCVELRQVVSLLDLQRNYHLQKFFFILLRRSQEQIQKVLLKMHEQYGSMSERLSEPLFFAPCGDHNYIRYAKILDLKGRPVMVPYHDEEESIQKLYEYYYENSPSKDRVVFVKMDRENSPKRNFSIGFYTANISDGDILFKTASEQDEDFYEQCFEPDEKGSFNIYVKDKDGFQITVHNVTGSDTIKKVKELYIEEKLSTDLSLTQSRIRKHVDDRVKTQDFYYDKKKLQDNKILSHYYITNAVQFKVIEKMNNNSNQQIFVEHPFKPDILIPIKVEITQKVKNVKNSLAKEVKIPVEEQTLCFNGNELTNTKSLTDYKIQYGSILNLVLINNPEEKKQLFFYLVVKYSQQLILPYEDYKDWLVKDIIKGFVLNHEQTFCLLFGELILRPSQKLSRIERSKSFNIDQNFTVRVLHMGGKVMFSEMIHDETLKAPWDHQSKINQAVDKGSINKMIGENRVKNPELGPSIPFYTSVKFYKQMNASIQNFSKIKQQDLSSEWNFNFCKALYNDLKKLPNYIGDAHRGTDFRLAKHYKSGDRVCWSRFTSASIDLKVAKSILRMSSSISSSKGGDAGTIFHIKSLTGKQITQYSCFKGEKQILFLPYTYFLIEKVTYSEDLDQFWLSEIPTLHNFKNRVVLWVDDVPKNNINVIKKYADKSIDFIQLTSTIMAETWAKEFGWMLHYRGIDFRLISDMVRFEGQPPKENYQAGVDLMKIFYNVFGLTTPIMIYCGNKERALKTIEDRKIIKNRVYKVGVIEAEVRKFIESEKIEQFKQ